MKITSVRRFGTSDFLLLDGKGLSRLEGATGRVQRLDGVGCAWTTSAMSDRACLTAVGRPGHPGQFLVVRADGAAERWELRADGTTGKIDEEILSPVSDAEDYEAARRLALFRSDGRAVAVATGAGVYVWRIGRDHAELLADDVDLVDAYDERGLLVLSTADGEQQLRRDDGGEPVPLFAADVVRWVFDGRLLHGETALGRVTYDLGQLTGQADAADVCKLMPRLDPQVWGSLRKALAVGTSPPCQDLV
ncbi:hypothetical protein [Streptomyces sp. NPDC050263]|uniref:hypothetical protein n=1 Tax=Streptomyces sp. NPDC050263 TaxID=3155037 RepID=UPI0034330DFF